MIFLPVIEDGIQMILENVRGKVRVRHRDNAGQRIVTEITDSDFDTRPYCFVKTKNA